MARVPNSTTDVPVEVEGVGTFVFAVKRTLRDQCAIEAEFARLTEGVDTVTAFLGGLATMMAELKVLTVDSPAGWNLDDMDPLEADSYSKLMAVWSAFRDKQAMFRKGLAKPGEGRGAPA